MMYLLRRKMDPKLIGQQWSKFLKQQINQLSTVGQSSEQKDDEDLIKNPYYSKYADKLKDAKHQSKDNQKINLNSLSDEEKKVKDKFIELEKKLDTKKTDDLSPDASSTNQSTSKSKPNKIKKLDDVIKLELIKDLDKDEIKKIWFEYFKTKDNTLFACLDYQNYDLIEMNARKYPIFVFLLPVDNSDAKTKPENLMNKTDYQFVLVQFQKNQTLQCYFTPLAFFHAHRENAPAALVVNYYSDIKQDKQIVLMEGEYDDKIFNLLEAQCLTNQIQLFYANSDRQSLLNDFNNNPSTFDYMNIVKEFETSLQI